jgi:membrane peptidoglycan carboxypeptidase
MRIIGNFIYWVTIPFVQKDARLLRLRVKEYYSEYLREYPEALNQFLIGAVIVAEDHRHLKHRGIDIVALCRALWVCLTKRSLQGGSTIEQQLTRTIIGRYERTFARKLRELILATTLESIIPKKDIASLYLYVAYFGARMNGINEALNRLKFSNTNITSRQAASIVARLKYPEPTVTSILRERQIQIRTDHILSLIQHSENEIEFSEVTDGVVPV